jgi:hypothetical protein
MSKKVDDEDLFYDDDIQSPPPNVYRSDPFEVGAEASGNQAHPPTAPTPTRPGAERVDGPGTRVLDDDTITVTIGEDEDGTIEPSPITLSAQLVNNVEEEHRVVQNFLQNAVVADIVTEIAPDRDEESGDENDDANDGDLPKRWFAICVIFLIVVAIFLIVIAVTVSLALVLPLPEPTAPGPTTPVPTTPVPTNPAPAQPPVPTLSPTPAPTLSPEAFLSDLLSSISFDDGVALSTPSTPQSMAFYWMVTNNTNLRTLPNEKIVQRYALATLYYSANGDSWNRKDYWLTDNEECGTWQSLTCTDNGTVSNLDLRDNNLNGTIPPEIGLLTTLGECTTMEERMTMHSLFHSPINIFHPDIFLMCVLLFCKLFHR